MESRLFLYAEDELCQVLAEAIVRHVKPDIGLVSNRTGGIGRLKVDLPKYVNLSRRAPVLIVVDLDRTACPLLLLEEWGILPGTSAALAFRIAVRECESWLMADAESLAAHFGFGALHLPRRPDEESDPKATFLAILKRRSRGKRGLIREMLPDPDAPSPVGLGYNIHLRTFVEGAWSVERAAIRSDSLNRAVLAVRALLA